MITLTNLFIGQSGRICDHQTPINLKNKNQVLESLKFQIILDENVKKLK
jgi:hypothetical protein